MSGDHDGDLLRRLRKLPPEAASEETLSRVLETLWRTRRSGLDPAGRARVQSLLGISSVEHLNPILACLRSVIRQCIHEKLTRDEIINFFPPDISVELQNSLVMVLIKYQSRWMEEASQDQPFCQWSSIRNQIQGIEPPSCSSFLDSESPSLWSRKGVNNLNSETVEPQDPSILKSVLAPVSSVPLHCNAASPRDPASLPRLKSLTWTLQNRNSRPDNRVAIITLKLQDYKKLPSAEIEVKFQLARDTLEAMLRSLSHISEQMSNTVEPTPEPLTKKQKQ